MPARAPAGESQFDAEQGVDELTDQHWRAGVVAAGTGWRNSNKAREPGENWR